MAEILIQILIVIFSVLLLGGIVWTLFWRNHRKFSPYGLTTDKMRENEDGKFKRRGRL